MAPATPTPSVLHKRLRLGEIEKGATVAAGSPERRYTLLRGSMPLKGCNYAIARHGEARVTDGSRDSLFLLQGRFITFFCLGVERSKEYL